MTEDDTILDYTRHITAYERHGTPIPTSVDPAVLIVMGYQILGTTTHDTQEVYILST